MTQDDEKVFILNTAPGVNLIAVLFRYARDCVNFGTNKAAKQPVPHYLEIILTAESDSIPSLPSLLKKRMNAALAGRGIP